MLDEILNGGPPAQRRTRKPGRPGMVVAQRASASSIVEADLRHAIVSMAMLPGTALNEKELITRYGVSRTPVREALLRLREDGLVEIFPQAGTFVSRIPADNLTEAVVIRQGLESVAVEHAARRRPPAALERLEALIAEQREAASKGDQDRFHVADEEFHQHISEIAGYPGIWRLAQTVKAQIDRCRRLTLPVPGRMAKVIQEHRTIVEAIRRGDEKAAREAVIVHVEAVLPDIDDMRRSNPDYFI